mmetsp:Transcript_35104/g.109184  ORF Transcript_35104/g.109184 Transcript_35104/m.109184 type:complete len:510 (+) Transcript_35104:97-1626(+)
MSDRDPDRELRRAIAWLNNEGGFDNALQYMKIAEAAAGLPFNVVQNVINNLVDKCNEVNDPTSWVCAGLSKEHRNQAAEWGEAWSGEAWAGEAWPGEAWTGEAWAGEAWPGEPRAGEPWAADAWAGEERKGDGGKGASTAGAEGAGPVGASANAADASGAGDAGAGAANAGAAGVGAGEPPAAAPSTDIDPEVLDRVAWLNGEGGFDGAVRYNDVAAAAIGVPTEKVITILTHCGEKRAQINDPTSWVCAALHKERNGKGRLGGKGQGPGSWPAGGGGDWYGGDYMSYGDPDQRLRKRVAWMNGEGGFQEALHYNQIAEAAAGVEAATVMKVLSHLMDKRDEVKDPTSWVCAALCKERSGKGTKGSHKGGGGWGADGPGGWGGGYWCGDANPDRELRKRVAWMNNEGGFENTIFFDEVAEASCGLEAAIVMRILTHLQDSKMEIENPTSWVCAALCKERARRGLPPPAKGKAKGKGKGKGREAWGPPVGAAGKGPGVQKHISKKSARDG